MTVVDEQPISLEEPSNVLETLFQFIHPCLEAKQYRQPSVMDLEPELFFAVAEAAEKYIVYGAMNIFLTRMQWLAFRFHKWCCIFIIFNSQVVEDRPVEVLNHCDKHGYQDLANTAAYNSLAQPLGSVIDGLTTPGLLARWVTLLLLLHVTNLTKVMSSFDIITIGAMSSFMLTTYSQTGCVRTITWRSIWPPKLRIHVPSISTCSSRPQFRTSVTGVASYFLWSLR